MGRQRLESLAPKLAYSLRRTTVDQEPAPLITAAEGFPGNGVIEDELVCRVSRLLGRFSIVGQGGKL
jgi:hypothetical protein